MKRNLMTGAALLAGILVFSACGGGKKKDAAAEETKPVPVKIMTAEYEDIPTVAEYTSTIRGYTENNIAPTMPLRIDKILVETGDRVSKGQLLAKMDPTNYNASAVQLAILEADYLRYKTVFDAGGISNSQMAQIESELKVVRDQTENLRINTELRSPTAGVVTARNYDPGDIYAGQPVLQVMQIDRVKVSAAISENYFPLVKIGTPAEVRVDMYPDKVFEGKVSLISPVIDAGSRTFSVEITIPNPKMELRPGMFSRTTMHFASTRGIMVDDLAVQRQLGSSEKYIYVIKNGQAEYRAVATGRQIGNRIELLYGVEAGDQVAIAGISKLGNGVAVEVQN